MHTKAGLDLNISPCTMESFYRACARILVKIVYKTEFSGFEKIPDNGPAILIANHASYMDGVIIQAACKRPVRFLIDHFIYNLPGVNYFMKLNRGIPILAKKESVEHAFDEISKGLESGDLIGIFPEGQLTYTGHLGRFKPGIEWIIDRDPVPVYPIIIVGLWDSMFSRKYRKSRFRWFPRSFRRKIVAICGDPIHPGNLHVNHLQRTLLGMLVAAEKKY